MRLKQICNHPSEWLGDGVYDENDSGKFERLREIGETIASRQEKLLVFTQFKEIIPSLAHLIHDGSFSRGWRTVWRRGSDFGVGFWSAYTDPENRLAPRDARSP